MGEPTPEERRRELSEAFAEGLDIFENRRAERLAKEAAAKAKEGGENDGTSGESQPRKSWADRLLG